MGGGYGYAAKVLYDCVAAEKYYMPDDMTIGRSCQLPNIAAFQLNDDTGKYIKNCFSALSLTWQFIPDKQQLKSYRNALERSYEEECLWLFDNALLANRNTLKRMHSLSGILYRFVHFLVRGY